MCADGNSLDAVKIHIGISTQARSYEIQVKQLVAGF